MVVDALVVSYASHKGPFPALVPSPLEGGSPAAYVNLYVHVPVAIASYVLYAGGFIASLLYLVRGKKTLDRVAEGFIITATLYAAYTLISGITWADESWGVPWNWDPRETGVLLLFLGYLVYFAIRSSVRDPDRRAVVSSVYAVAAFVLVPLSYLAPYIAGGSLHPTRALTGALLEHTTTRVLFVSRIVTSISLGLAASAAFVRRRKAELVLSKAFWAGLAAAVVIVAVSGALLLAPYLGGNIARVRGGELNEKQGTLTLVLKTGEELLTAVYDLDRGPPISPLKINGSLTLIGHVVSYIGTSDGKVVYVEKLEVLKPPTVVINVLLYAILIIGIALTLKKAGGEG
jgi:hypothetical protein